MSTREASIGVICLLLGALVFWLTKDFPGFHARGVDLPGPGFFPNFIAVVLIICSGFQFLRAIREGKKAKEEGKHLPTLRETFRSFIHSTGMLTMAITTLAVIVYVLVLNAVGFQLATLVFLVVLMVCFRVRPVRAVLYSVIVVVVMVAIFEKVFHVPLPWGILHLGGM